MTRRWKMRVFAVVAMAAGLAAVATTTEARNFDRGMFSKSDPGRASVAGDGPVLDFGLDRLDAGLGGALRGDADRCDPYGVYGDDCG